MDKRTRINVKFRISLKYLEKEEATKSFERRCRYLDINDFYNFIVDLYIEGTKVFKSSITDINIIMTEIEIIYPVSFTKNGFIHSKVLNQYDLDGQIDILLHFLKTQDWEIINNEIIFSKLINDKYIQRLLKTFEKEYIINNESQKSTIINECEVFGIATTKKNIQNKIQKEKSDKEKLEIILNSNKEFYALNLKKYNPKFTKLGNKNNKILY